MNKTTGLTAKDRKSESLNYNFKLVDKFKALLLIPDWNTTHAENNVLEEVVSLGLTWKY